MEEGVITMGINRPVAIDVFAGAGGLSEGLLAAGINVAVAVEKHPHPALTCAFNHSDTTVVCGNIAGLKMEKLAGFVQKRTGSRSVDIVVGGPPCQGFSPAGLRNPNDPRNRLFRKFLKVVEYFEPRVFLFENVPGFVKLYEGEAIKAIVAKFRALGYEMHEINAEQPELFDDFPLLDAADFGVPQRRRRFILVGWLKNELENDFAWPNATRGPSSRLKREYESIADALNDLDFLTAGHESHVYPEPPASDYQIARRRNTEILFNHLATKHRPSTIRMYRRLSQGDTIRMIPKEFRSGKQTMARLLETECSKAVLALPDDFVHYRRHRIPTVREMARLQSFDDDFVFLGKRTTSDKNRRVDVPQYTQVGNAVPPLLAKALGKAILRALGYGMEDLRNRAVRRERQSWIRGSSAFSGYTLGPDAKGQIDLINNQGNALRLPISDEELAVEELERVTDWTRFSRRKRAAAS